MLYLHIISLAVASLSFLQMQINLIKVALSLSSQTRINREEESTISIICGKNDLIRYGIDVLLNQYCVQKIHEFESLGTQFSVNTGLKDKY